MIKKILKQKRVHKTRFLIPISRTSFSKYEVNSVINTLRSGWLVQGPQVQLFEEKWCAFTKAKNSIAVSSCTSALHLALLALGFKRGDEAIVPAFTWISTANVVENLGGKVKFCDINLETFNIDCDQIESKISKNTRVILPVHLFGAPADMGRIHALAKKYNLLVVEDAACGLGTKIHNRHVGLFGDIGCFSFHPRKSLTTGEGGMITTRNNTIAERLKRLRDHGAIKSDFTKKIAGQPFFLADHSDAGLNQRMTDFQAALGVAQMKRVKEIISERKRLASIYNSELLNKSWLKPQKILESGQHGYQSYACLFQPFQINKKTVKKINCLRNQWMVELYKVGISTRPATHAVHMLSYYKKKYNLKASDFPNAWMANDCSISLPLFDGLKPEEQKYIISHLVIK